MKKLPNKNNILHVFSFLHFFSTTISINLIFHSPSLSIILLKNSLINITLFLIINTSCKSWICLLLRSLIVFLYISSIIHFVLVKL